MAKSNRYMKPVDQVENTLVDGTVQKALSVDTNLLVGVFLA